MRRNLAVLGLVVVVAAGVLLVQRAGRDRTYRDLLQAGQQALDSQNSYAAIEAFTGAITLRPDSMVAHFRRGQAYHAQHQDEQAVRDLREAERLDPDAPQPLIALGDLYDTTGNAAQAAVWYGQAAERLKGGDPTLLYKLAVARYRAGFPAEAIEPLRQAVARNEMMGEAHYLLGVVYRDAQQPDNAIASLERALKVSPSLIPAREELADLYREKGRHLDEMTQLQALAASDTRTSRSVAIALAEARQGQFAAAVGSLSAAGDPAPEDSQVQLALARVYLARAERTFDRASAARALEALEAALGGTARRSEGLALFGRALSLQGDDRGAERILREAVATSPVHPDAFRYLAEVSERLSHFSEARDALITLDVLQGDTAPPAVRAVRAQRIGTLALRAGDPASAVTYLTQALGAGRGAPAVFSRLAQARLLLGDRAAAEDAIAKGLALDPNDVELLRLRRTIR